MTALTSNSVTKSEPCGPSGNIHLMSDGLRPGQLDELSACLSDENFNCVVFEGAEGIRAAFEDPNLKLLLLSVSDGDDRHLIETIRAEKRGPRDIPILVHFAQRAAGQEQGFLVPEIDDFLLDPLNLNDLVLRVRRLINRGTERREESSLIAHFGMQQFISKAPAFAAAVEKIPRIAACDAPVLLIGDTGTGKEMCARAIHYLSPRARKPFIPVNCGSIPVDLFENEMFGHEPGAFTDARHARRGLVAEAEGGTLFLDEVDSLSASAQVKLLRFLQDRQYRPLGASNYRQSDTRILAASNQNLLNKVQERVFREDLYYRLKVVSLKLPALRDRPEDIMALAQHFLKNAALEYKSPVSRFSHDAMQKLMSWKWPGNVRELENVVRQAVVLADGAVLRAHELHLTSDSQAPAPTAKESFKAAKARVVESFERTYLREMIAACGGNISQAARESKKNRRAFFALLKKHGLTAAYHGQLQEQGCELAA